MQFHIFFAASLVAFAVASSAASGSPSDATDLNLDFTLRKPSCDNKCNFRLCKVDGLDSLAPVGRSILLRDPGISIPPFLCRKDLILGDVLETGEARVKALRGGGRFRPVSKYRPSGLSNRFSKDYFGLAQINFPPLAAGKIGIARQGNVGNQDDFAGDLCAILPIKKYTILNKKGKVIKTVRKGSRNDCVSFSTTITNLLIEFTWETGDDLDLVVEEPDGTVISKDNFRSAVSGGALNNNNNDEPNACNNLVVGKEQVIYKKGRDAPTGEYKVTLIHRKRCNKAKRTPWSLYVISEGDLIAGTTGTSNKDNGKVISTIKFNL